MTVNENICREHGSESRRDDTLRKKTTRLSYDIFIEGIDMKTQNRVHIDTFINIDYLKVIDMELGLETRGKKPGTYRFPVFYFRSKF